MTEPQTYILVDISGSTDGYREPLAQSVQALYAALAPSDERIQVVGYSSEIVGPALYPGVESIRDRAAGGGSTPTGAAILALDLQPGDTLILLTDGPEDQPARGYERPQAQPILRQLADEGVHILGAIWGQEWAHTWNPNRHQTKKEWLEEATDLIFGDGHAAFYGETIEEAVQIIADALGLGDLGIYTSKPQVSKEAPSPAHLELKSQNPGLATEF